MEQKVAFQPYMDLDSATLFRIRHVMLAGRRSICGVSGEHMGIRCCSESELTLDPSSLGLR